MQMTHFQLVGTNSKTGKFTTAHVSRGFAEGEIRVSYTRARKDGGTYEEVETYATHADAALGLHNQIDGCLPTNSTLYATCGLLAAL